ncbi:hypothetical protein ACBI99_44635 [Nonomuraea sp. ATR24]
MSEPMQPAPQGGAEPTPGDGDQDVSQDPAVTYESEVDDDQDA